MITMEDYTRLLNNYQELQQENNFLRKRENKLQMIEKMFKNEPVDLIELAKLVKSDKE